MGLIIPTPEENPIGLLKRCGGYYNQEGTEGPLVGYAGTYDTPDGPRQYVGRVYANFAMAERHGPVLGYCLERLSKVPLPGTLASCTDYTGFCGAPQGGLALASVLAFAHSRQYIFPDKEVIALKTATSRQKSRMVFDRHGPKKGEKWWLVEDVVNNVSTPKDLIPLFDEVGAEVLGILCFLNRSEVHESFCMSDGRVFPIVPIVRQPTKQWRQDDPEVSGLIAKGQIVWKPKIEWEKIASFVR